MNKIKQLIPYFLQDLFVVGLIIFTVFMAVDLLAPRLITAHVNMNMFLLILIVLGGLMIIFKPRIFNEQDVV